MVIVRILVLGFLVFFAFSMGQQVELNAFGKFVVGTLIFTAPALYFLPTYEAFRVEAPNRQSILLLNLLLGWTLLGWVVALVWAMRQPEPVEVRHAIQPPPWKETPPAPRPTAGAAAPTKPQSVADELQKLVQLRDAGVLTADEFDQQKRATLRASQHPS